MRAPQAVHPLAGQQAAINTPFQAQVPQIRCSRTGTFAEQGSHTGLNPRMHGHICIDVKSPTCCERPLVRAGGLLGQGAQKVATPLQMRAMRQDRRAAGEKTNVRADGASGKGRLHLSFARAVAKN